MDKNYYKEYFTLERNHWWFKARINILRTHIRSLLNDYSLNGNVKILNVGAGTGFTSEMLMKFGETTSVEYDIDCCKLVLDKTGMEFENESITELPYPDNSFDIVTSFDVVEHIEDDLKAVSELKRVTKKGGMIITTVPAYKFLWSHHDEVNHHYRRYTKKTYLKLWGIERDEVKVIYKTYFNSILFLPIAFFRVLSNLFLRILNRTGSGSDFGVYKAGIVDKTLYLLMNCERKFVKSRIGLPFGVSFLVSMKKI